MEPFESSRPRLVGGRCATETDPTANSTSQQGLAPADSSCDQLAHSSTLEGEDRLFLLFGAGETTNLEGFDPGSE